MKEDARMDLSALDEESAKTPILHGKYYGFMMEEVRILKLAEQEWDSVYREKFEYYTGKSKDQIYEDSPLDLRVAKTDLDIYIKADRDLQALQRKLNIQKTKCKMLEDYIKNVINSRGFQIRDAVEFLKFKNGIK
jgi:hypothetical protein